MSEEKKEIQKYEDEEIDKNEFQGKLQRLLEQQKIINELMREGLHYMRIPGTDKPSLLKPGAELLSELYGFYSTFQIMNEILEFERGFFYYKIQCILYSKKTNQKISEGFGSHSTYQREDITIIENKIYEIRWIYENQLDNLNMLHTKIIKRKELTNRKTGGKFYQVLVPNKIFCDDNTILKMAEKSAFIDATLKATRSSGIFTQDLEDMKKLENPESISEKKEDLEIEKPKENPLIIKATELINELGMSYWKKWKEENKIEKDKSKLIELNENEIKNLISYLEDFKQKKSEETKEIEPEEVKE